jgi:dienelactone hydrolase
LYIIFAALLGSPASAQVNLGFPKEPQRNVQIPGPGLVTGSSLFAPAAAGPRPAVVLSHTCGGLRTHVFQWAARLVDAGYVALVIDHFGPRKVTSNCWPKYSFSYNAVAQDAVAGMKHLRTLPFVDGKRIAHMGFSMGAMAGLRSASPSFRRAHLGGERFAAIVSFYPFCAYSGLEGQENFYGDTDAPLLLLLGEKDDEAAAAPCVQQARALAARGAPVKWIVFPDTTHAFDGPSLTRQSGGKTFTYRHNPRAVEEAWRESREFLARHMPGK